jgi:hypothetical protein
MFLDKVKIMDKRAKMEELSSYGYKVVGPLMAEYVYWILKECIRNKIEKIYFLARDGYLLKEMASLLCEKNGLNIECRYLYCSRIALRTPTYSFIGEEAYEYLFYPSLNITLRLLLNRLLLNIEEIRKVCEDIGADIENIDRELNTDEFEVLKQKLKRSPVYNKYMLDKSKSGYKNTVEYLRQEGLFESDVVIVDVGWAGTMQHSLARLLKREGYKGKIEGYYFGMYHAAKSEEAGIYHTFYFDFSNHINRKAQFDNKLFEIMLTAPHGMTLFYECRNGEYIPVLQEYEMKEEINFSVQVHKGALSYLNDSPDESFRSFDTENAQKRVCKLIGKHIMEPDRAEVELFRRVYFSDDVFNSNLSKVIEDDPGDIIKNNLFYYRILNKLIFRKKEKIKQTIWPYGIAALYSNPKKIWYRLNIYMYEYIKYFLLRKRER